MNTRTPSTDIPPTLATTSDVIDEPALATPREITVSLSHEFPNPFADRETFRSSVSIVATVHEPNELLGIVTDFQYIADQMIERETSRILHRLQTERDVVLAEQRYAQAKQHAAANSEAVKRSLEGYNAALVAAGKPPVALSEDCPD